MRNVQLKELACPINRAGCAEEARNYEKTIVVIINMASIGMRQDYLGSGYQSKKILLLCFHFIYAH